MLTKERRKQKDFFEKGKLKSKMKLLRVSPPKGSAVSLDLLNLYVVNQISTKKENIDNIRKPVHVDINREIKVPLRTKNIEFPRSPECRPTKLFLDDSQHRIQQEILENRRKYLSEKGIVPFECLQSSKSANNKYEDIWFFKTAYRQGNFSDSGSDTPVGLCFQQLNSPENDNPIDQDPGTCQTEEPLFGIMSGTPKSSQGETFQPTATLFEEKNQPFLTIPPSPFYSSFTNQSYTGQLFTDFGDTEEIPSKHSLYNNEEMHQRTRSAQSCPAERDLTGVFTAPEAVFSCHNKSLNAVHKKSIRNQTKDYCHQKRNTTVFENTGGFKNHKKDTKVTKTLQNYSKSGRRSGLADPNVYFKIFEHEELDKEIYNDLDQHSEQGRQKDDDSQLSSQSPTYSPNQEERHASPSSNESKLEEWNEEASYDSEGSVSGTSSPPQSGSGNRRSECICQFDNGSWNTTNKQSRTKSATALRKNMWHRAQLELSEMNHKGRHSISCQTDACAELTEKSNAAVQCDIIKACSCKKELSFALSAEIVTSTSKVETTGGHNIPSDSTSASK